MPVSSKWSLSFRFPHQNPVHASPIPLTRCMPHPSHSSRFPRILQLLNMPTLDTLHPFTNYRRYVEMKIDGFIKFNNLCRLQLKCAGTRWRTRGEAKGKLANGVGSQYPSHYLGTWCIQHYYRWCAHLGCQQSTELTSSADLNGLVCFVEKRNLVSAHVPSHFKLWCFLTTIHNHLAAMIRYTSQEKAKPG